MDGTYGADGLRRSATVGGVTTYYAYDGQSCAQEYKPGANSQLNVSANYLMGARGPECRTDESDISESFQSAAASSYFHQVGATGYANSYPVFADGPRAHTSWYVYDGLGSVVGTVDGKSLAYSPGPKRDVYGIARTSATLPTPHGFVGALGHLTDPTGLIYMRERYYDPHTGRFISEDPSGNGQNWYIYCSGDPVNEKDRTGKDGELVSTLGASNISAIMDGIGSTMDLDLEGEVVDLSGVLNEQAKFIVRGLEGDKNTLGAGEWNYLAKQVAGTPGSFVKAWVRWNEQLEIFDYYLDADAGDVFEHATPNVGSVNY